MQFPNCTNCYKKSTCHRIPTKTECIFVFCTRWIWIPKAKWKAEQAKLEKLKLEKAKKAQLRKYRRKKGTRGRPKK